jgi:hypothetical protein
MCVCFMQNHLQRRTRTATAPLNGYIIRMITDAALTSYPSRTRAREQFAATFEEPDWRRTTSGISPRSARFEYVSFPITLPMFGVRGSY